MGPTRPLDLLHADPSASRPEIRSRTGGFSGIACVAFP